MKKCGIYIITNNKNDKVYIGQSVDIMCRWNAHKYSALNERQDSHTKLHQAMKNIGIENFSIKVLEECSFSELNKKEIYWIKYFNSYENGYNMTPGGSSNIGENNPNAKLTISQVEEIRMAYNNHIRFKEVYEKYKGIISKRGLQKVWHFETWRHILPEVYTEENRQWHKTASKENFNGNLNLGKNNKKRACGEEEIELMRQLRKGGLSYAKIAERVGRSVGVVQKYCKFQECKNNNKISNSIIVKNIETGLVFDSLTEAAKWSQCDKHTISKNKNTTKSAGIVPSSNEPAHWKTL